MIDDKKEKNEYPKVSIIIPVYNGEKYVSLAIDSALRQTYKNVEVIVVNDGSKDKTDKICKLYKNKIKYIKKENGGVSTALNVGIENMSGDYFSWLSHDDLYYPEKIETEINYLREHNLFNTKTILYSNHSFLYENGYRGNESIYDSSFLNRDSAYAIMQGGINGITQLIPKKAFYDVGFFDVNSRCVQDYKLWFEMYKYGYKFIHIPYILTATRIHDESDTHTNPRYVTEGTDFWLNTIEYFSNEEKIRLYGSIYGYYYTLYNFLKDGPYTKVIDYLKKKYIDLEKKYEKGLNNKVSVLVLLEDYNYEKTIRSVIKQSYKNIEIIILNNGIISSEKLNDDYKKYSNINIINYENKKNNSEILNEGIQKSSGEYITFIKSNAIWDEEKIKKQLLKIVASNYSISDTSYLKNGKIINTGALNGYSFDIIMRHHCIDISTIMVKKSYLIDNNISFKSQYMDDNSLCFILDSLKDNRIIGLQEPLVTIDYDLNSEEIINNYSIIIRYIFDNYGFINKSEINNILFEYMKLSKGLDSYELVDNHIKELNRYVYFQTNEFKTVSKIKNITRKITFRKNISTYSLDSDKIKNGRISRGYRKLQRIINKIKK